MLHRSHRGPRTSLGQRTRTCLPPLAVESDTRGRRSSPEFRLAVPFFERQFKKYRCRTEPITRIKSISKGYGWTVEENGSLSGHDRPLWSIASDYGHCRRGFRALASDKTEVSAGHSSRGRLKIENVARDIRGPEIEKSPASVAVKAAPITCTLEFARVISTLGGMRGGTCFDIGNTTREALIRFERTGDPVAGSTDPQSAGNGSLMRLAPAAIRHYADFARAIEVARRQSVTTHAAAASVDACAFFAGS
jgi:ADP-ribosylglycohydrolase